MIELMVTVTIAGILLSLALPSYQNMVKNNCLTAKANSLVSSFQLARSEAVRQRAPISIVATNAAAASNKWGSGWTVEDAVGADIRVVQLSCDTTTIDNAVTTYTYDASGFPEEGTVAGTFDFCDDRTGETGRQLTLSTTGRPSIDATFTCP